MEWGERLEKRSGFYHSQMKFVFSCMDFVLQTGVYPTGASILQRVWSTK